MIDAPVGSNLEELMLQLAVYIDKADQTSDGDALPADEGEQRILRRWINEGYSLFMRSDPRWSFLKRQVELTLSNIVGPENVNGETWRIRLPSFVRGFPSPAVFSVRQNDITTAVLCIREAEWIDRNIALDGTRSISTPVYFACRAIPISDRSGAHGLGKGGADDWEVLFYPRPSRPYKVGATFPVRWTKLIDHNDRTICGPEHDQAIVFAAEYLYLARDSDDRTRREEAKTRWLESLGSSIRLDAAKRLPAFDKRPKRYVERSTWTVGDNSTKITP